jgi:hypothetical protein
MSPFHFRPAVRESVPLILGIVGPSGGGKTMSALRLATGMAGDKRFAVLDTEAGRAKHYADVFSFDHGDLDAPFSPDRYAEAIAAADTAGYPVIVVDSGSHEHAGEGGLLDMQEEEFQRMGGKDSVKMASWIRPKRAHKKMVSRLLQLRAHLILCFRAEQRVDMVKGADGKIQVVPKTTLSGFSEWIPVAEKNILYELTASFLLTPDAPGHPKPIKLQQQMRPFFPLDQPITEESGRRLAEWARGGASAVPVPAGVAQGPAPAKGTPSSPRAESTAATTDAPDLAAERKAWLEKVVAAENAMNMKSADRLALWRKHAGDAKEQNVDPSQLEAMFKELAARPGTAA